MERNPVVLLAIHIELHLMPLHSQSESGPAACQVCHLKGSCFLSACGSWFSVVQNYSL